MKKLFAIIVLCACTSVQEKYVAYGEKITPTDAITTDAFLSDVSVEEKNYKVKGTIEEVCQMKGCWMTLKNESGATIRVTFKDYGFFVPKEIGGSEVIIEGVASKKLVDEELARHYAEDGGKEYDESMRDAITFVAHGVLVKTKEG